MKILAIGTATSVIGLVSAPAGAQSLSFFGEVGSAPVFVSLNRTGDTLSGYYFYAKQGKPIDLRGTVESGAFAMDESSTVDGKKTGSFKGQLTETGWSGTWQSPDGRQLALSTTEREPLTDLDGSLRCRTSEKDSGYTFIQSLDLAALKGRITRFSFSNEAKGPNDHMCSIGFKDLKQIPSDLGISLRAKKDDVSDTSKSALHCSFQLEGSKDFILIRANGCQGAGSDDVEMFCPMGAAWADLIVDRRTQACKIVE